MCGLKKTAAALPGVFAKGEWYCNQKCCHGGKAMHTIDELIDLLRGAFSERPEVMARIKDAIQRSLESI